MRDLSFSEAALAAVLIMLAILVASVEVGR